MKKYIPLFIAFICFSTQAQNYKSFSFNEFQSSSSKQQFLTEFMIQETTKMQKEKPHKFKTICNQAKKYRILEQNHVVAHVQISCDNLQEDWHALMIKLPNMYSTALPCSYDKGKFDKSVWCRKKL